LVATCKLFVENPNLLKTPYLVRLPASEGHFRLFLTAIEGVTTQIGIENALDLESLSWEFQFLELGRQVGEFLSQHPHVEVVRLKSAILDLQKQIAGQDRELCQLTGAMGEVRRQIEAVTVKLSGTEDAVERRVGPLGRAVLGLAETRDGTSRIESDVTRLRVAITDGSATVEAVRREVAGLKAELSDRCPKMKKDLANLEQGFTKLKEDFKAMRPKPESLAPPVAHVAVPPALKAVSPAQKSLNSAPPPNRTPPPPKSPPVKV
jgi:hypothetical protein